MLRIKTALLGAFGSTTAFGSLGVSREFAVESWLRVVVLLVGLVSALLSIYWMQRMNSAKLRRINEERCDECLSTSHWQNCSTPPNNRPAHCPLKA